MPVPSPRNKILPARGTYATLAANVASLFDGEICYAIDQDQYYQNEGGTLVAVGATKAQGILADSATQPGDNVSTLTNDAGYITSAGAPVQSVNSQTGTVILDADDIDDTSTTNKFATAAELSLIGTATQPGDNISTLTNDSGYITSAGAPVQSVAGKTGVVTLVKGDVGLGNVDNTSDLDKPISTATQTALNLKADLASPALTGAPTAPTAAVGTNTTQLATTAFVNAEIANDAPTKTGGGASGTWGIDISGTAATATVANSIADNTVTSGKIVDGAIVNADVNASAAIAGTKISPDFGAQNVTTTGSITGAGLIPSGASVPANGVYLPAANSVGIATGSSERLRIDSSGRLGLGTSTPGSILEITQNGATSFRITRQNAVSNYCQIQAAGTNSEQLTIETDPTNSSGTASFIDFRAANALRMRVNGAGNVGIGTASPARPLHIAASDCRIRLTDTNADTVVVELQNSSGSGILTTSGATSLLFSPNNSERLRIDSSGRLLVGTSSAIASAFGTVSPRLQVATTTSGPVSFLSYASDTFGARLDLCKSRGTTVGTNTIVASGDDLGDIYFNGADGTNFIPAALIRGEVDGTPASNSLPGRLVFSTTADGSSSPTERMRIDSAGFVSLGGDTNTGLSNPSADNLAITTGGSERARIDSSGRLLVGTSSALGGYGYTPQFQIYGSTPSTASCVLEGVGTPVYPTFSRRNAGQTAVANNDTIFQLRAYGFDGALPQRAAVIEAAVDGTPGANDMPGRLVFATTASGSATPTERMRIDSSGRVGIGSNSPDQILDLQVTGTASGGGPFIRLTDAYAGGWTANSDSSGIEFFSADTSGPGIGVRSKIANTVEDTTGAGQALTFWTTANSAGQSLTERLRIDSSGRLLVGTSTSVSQFGVTPQIQITGTSGSGGYQGLTVFNTAQQSAPSLVLGHSKGASVGTYTASVAGDLLGEVSFTAANGTDMRRGASIGAWAEDTWATNDHPARLVFSTTADGASSPTERMRIKSNGVINFASCPTYADDSAAGTGGLVAGDIYKTSTGELRIKL